jgi:hypothetical protein
MAEYLQAPPRRKALGLLADALTSGQEALNTVNLPYVGGLGGLLFGQAPQYLQDVSYGMPAFRGGNVATGGLGTITPDTRMLDVATLPFVGAGAAKAGQVGAKTLGKEVARQVETGTGLIGSNVLDPRQYMFIGEKSKAWDTASNKVAKALEKEGLAPETIWSQTGNVKAPDGKWRQEISDLESKTIPVENKDVTYSLPKVLSHEKLYQSYPNLDETMMGFKKTTGQSSSYSPQFNMIKIGEMSATYKNQAQYDKELNNIYKQAEDLQKKGLLTVEKDAELSKKADDLANKWFDTEKVVYEPSKSPLLHEVQHAIQEKENFARGGSTSLFSQDIQDKVFSANQKIAEKNAQMNETYKMLEEARANKFNDPSSEKRIAALKDRYDKLLEEKLSYVKDAQLDPQEEAYKQYKRLFGEAEARLTQNRIPLTQEQRLQYYPYAQGQYGLDVPYGELIVQGLLK